MNINVFVFILIISFVLFFLNMYNKENFKLNLQTNKYNLILINHENYKIIILKNNFDDENNDIDKIIKIYKIYKN